MDGNKIIVKNELSILGKISKVQRYWDDIYTKSIDIFQALNIPQKGVQSCATIGLYKTDIGLISDDKELRAEILGALDISVNVFENIMASIAFEIMDRNKCFPGYMIDYIIPRYIQDSDMKHILITNPFVWEHTESLLLENCYVAWLMAVPISQREYEYAQNKGVDELETIFVEEQIDIYNIYRESVI